MYSNFHTYTIAIRKCDLGSGLESEFIKDPSVRPSQRWTAKTIDLIEKFFKKPRPSDSGKVLVD